MKHVIKIDGMGCNKCVAHVKEALEGLRRFRSIRSKNR